MSKAGGAKRGSPSVVGRLKRLRRLMEKRKLDGLLISGMENIRYMTGFTGSAASAAVTLKGAYFLTDGRYVTQARGELNGYRIRQHRAPLKDAGELINSLSIGRLGIESEHLSYSSFRTLRGVLRSSRVYATRGLVEELRMVKDGEELSALRGAAGLVKRALEETVGEIRPGISEREVAVELEHRFKLLGSEKEPFDLIVASGERGSLPHGIATDKKIRKGEMVTIDCGARWGGYYSDCTRTYVVGRPQRRQREIYQIVLDAQQKAIEAIRPGVRASEVDAAAREHISSKGYGKYFGHSTGHGVGLAVHEEPRLSSDNARELEAGMVVTVEPGIYVPDWGGVRIEDMAVVVEGGAEIITEGIDRSLAAL